MSGDGPAPGKRIFDAIGAQLVLRGLGGPPPRVGDAYVIEEILGAGGFGLICRATQVAMRRSVALKLHPLGGVADAGVREALREARSLARLEHPGIVGVYAVGESELIATERLPCAYVEMQLVEGQTLRSWREAVVPEAQSLVRVLVEAGRAVAHAHEQGVLHRDLKPDNVMIDASGHAKVIDFGLALATDEVTTDRALAAWGDGADALGTRATGTGLVRGTPGYMAPEASAGRPLAASDQFALAVMLREALTGRHPMLPATVAPVAAAAGGDGVRRRLEPVLARAMAVVVAERFDDVTALCDAIEAALRPRRGPWIAAASIATLGLAAGVTWWGTEAPSVVAAPSEAPAQTSTPTESGPTVADPATDEPPPEATSDGSTGDPPLPTVQASADPGVVALPSVHGRPEAGRVSCDDLTAWSGTWQVGARVMWTEFAYQLDTKID
ncbi:MAG: protein kinase, partial [Deltaproteobacteria bacterium]|nr:protein kinase [Deltaproteobacteria bacterium]